MLKNDCFQKSALHYAIVFIYWDTDIPKESGDEKSQNNDQNQKDQAI